MPITPDDLLGSTLNKRYLLRRILGRGGMGVVFDAENVRIGRNVAIKMVLPEYSANLEVLKRFEREARAATEIGNPHIVEILDFDKTSDNMYFIVMEFVVGEPLNSIIESDGKLAPERALDIAGQTLYALSDAHKAGIVHRDIKPENLMVCKRTEVSWKGKLDGASLGGRDYVKILDFGISRFIKPLGKEDKLTMTGSILGSPYYMSPEQAGGKSGIDARADIYSVGAVLYHMLSGKTPFKRKEDEGIVDILYRVMYDEPQPLGELEPTLPYGLIKAIDKAMAKEPGERFADSSSFMEVIREYFDFSLSGEFPIPEETKSQKPVSAAAPEKPKQPEKKPPSKEPAAKISTLPVFQDAKRPSAVSPEAVKKMLPSAVGGSVGGIVLPKEKIVRKQETARTFTTTVFHSVRRHKKAAIGVAFTAVVIVGVFLILFHMASQETEPAVTTSEEEVLPSWILKSEVKDQVSIGKKSSAEVAKSERSKEMLPLSDPAPPPKTLLFKVDSDPAGAWVVLDKVALGTTPFEKEMEADGRTRALTVTLDGYRSKEAELVFSKGKEKLEVFAELKKKKSKAASEEPEAPEAETEKPGKTEIKKAKEASEKPAEKTEPEKKTEEKKKKKKGDEIARDLDMQ